MCARRASRKFVARWCRFGAVRPLTRARQRQRTWRADAISVARSRRFGTVRSAHATVAATADAARRRRRLGSSSSSSPIVMTSEMTMLSPTARNIETWNVVFMSVAA